jgi:hypothetical protein
MAKLLKAEFRVPDAVWQPEQEQQVLLLQVCPIPLWEV